MLNRPILRPLLGLLAPGILLVLGLGHTVHAEVNGNAMLMLRRGMPRLALQQLDKALAERPDDPDLMAQTGASLEQLGLYVDAWTAFELSTGAGVYYSELGGLRNHADVLQAIGRHDEAVALRREALLTVGENAQLTHFVGMIDDLRLSGQLAEAREVGLEATSAFPNAALVSLALAEVELEAGNMEEALYLVWQAGQWHPTGSARLERVEAKICLAEGSLVEAREHILAYRRRIRRSPDALALLMELGWRESGPQAALDALATARQEVYGHPDVRRLEAEALLAVGRVREGRELIREMASLYPDRQDIQELARREGALPAP